jgi:hypothetical protein
MQYVLFNVPNLGFVEQTMEAMVDGIAESIRRAHEAIQPGSIFIRYGSHGGRHRGVRQECLQDLQPWGVSSSGMEAMVDGITESIRRAHEAIQPGSIFIRYGSHGGRHRGVHQEGTRGHTAWEYLIRYGSHGRQHCRVQKEVHKAVQLGVQLGSIFIRNGSHGGRHRGVPPGGHTRPYSLGVSLSGMETMEHGMAESIRRARDHTAWEHLHQVWRPCLTALQTP